jgi:hypothetical protein
MGSPPLALPRYSPWTGLVAPFKEHGTPFASERVQLETARRLVQAQFIAVTASCRHDYQVMRCPR